MIPRDEFVRLVVATVLEDARSTLTAQEKPFFISGARAAAEYSYTLIQVREANRGQ